MVLRLERAQAEEGPGGRPRTAGAHGRNVRAVRDVARRMVERRSLEADAVIGEGEEEGHERVLLRRGQAERPDLRVRERAAEVTPAIVEVHHLAQGGELAVVKVRAGQLDVAEPGRLELALSRLEDVAAVVGDRPDRRVDEAPLRIRGDGRVHEIDRGAREWAAVIALDAPGLAPEDVQPLLLLR